MEISITKVILWKQYSKTQNNTFFLIRERKSSIELKHKMLNAFLITGNAEFIPKSKVTFICIHNKHSKQIV